MKPADRNALEQTVNTIKSTANLAYYNESFIYQKYHGEFTKTNQKSRENVFEGMTYLN
jgi:hypothetical protein